MREASERRTVTDTDSYAFLVYKPINANEGMTEAQYEKRMKKIILICVAIIGGQALCVSTIKAAQEAVTL